MTATVLLCLCGCPKLDHVQGRRSCKECGTCDAFELDGEAPASPKHAAGGPIRSGERATVDDGDQLMNLAAVDLSESTSAALRRVEAERDNALRAFHLAEELRLKAGAELVSARTELDAVRTARDRLDAQLGEARRAQGDAADRQRINELVHELNSERARAGRLATEVAALRERQHAGLLYAYDTWSCLTDGGCGSRYSVHDPTHPCGLLTPTRLTVTHRTEGAPTA